MSDRLTALHDSVDRLSELVTGLDPDTLMASAYPTEWSVADALSHLGSGAVILLRRLDDGLAGVETPEDASRAVWDEWDAKSPEDQAADALVADRALLDRLEGLSDDERERFSFTMGPMTFDVDDFVGLRLNEHALHVWDVEVVLDPAATHRPRCGRSGGRQPGTVRRIHLAADRHRAGGHRGHHRTPQGFRRHPGRREGDPGADRPVGDPRPGDAGRGLHPPRLRPARPGTYPAGGR